MSDKFQGVKCLNKEDADRAKAQIKQAIATWATEEYGLPLEQVDELTNHVCSNAVQYSFSIGEDTEVSSLDWLSHRLLERISPKNRSKALMALMCFAVRYAQVDVMWID